MHWIDSRVVSLECEINPSVAAYQEVDAITRKTINGALGFGFERSPDGRHIANAGWIPHFSSAYEQSHYLEIDGKPVYPESRDPNEELNLARKIGDLYVNIHDFKEPWVWSPDSRLVALVDHEFDWELGRTEGEGREVDERYYLIVAGVGSIPERVKIEATSETPHLEWVQTDTIEITDSGKTTTYRRSDLSRVRR